MAFTYSRPLAAAVLLALGAAGPAAAHHPTGGKLPATFMEGLLSGLGHPVIGLDHFAFILAVGIAAALVRSGPALVAAFVAASTAGVVAHLAPLDLPLVEPLVALSVVAAGALIALRGVAGQPHWLALAAVAGFFHGHALAEAVIGAERAVIGAYLVGLAIVMAATAGAVMLAGRRLLVEGPSLAGRLRYAGGALGAFGLVLLVRALGAS